MPKRDNLKILHCADLHLGLRFSRYPEPVAERLREARFTTLERLVEKANASGCDLLVLAGDLFDSLQVPKRDLARAAKILSGFSGVSAVLPGNHDFHAGAADDFWKGFERPEHGRLLVLEESRAYPLAEHGLDAVLYASPCGSKYSETHGVGWLASAARPEARFHVGVAHGSFEGLSPDLQGNYFPMKAQDLLVHGLDLWLLGHIHVQYPPRAPGQADRIFYSGTHEPDGFDCRHEGRAWLLELGAGKELRADSLSTGQFRFREEELELRSIEGLEEFSRRFTDAEAARTLLKLELRGALRREEHERFAPALEALKARFLHLRPDFSALSLALAPEDIDREFAQGSFPHRLLGELAREGADREALQLAFELVQSCRSAR